MDRALAGRYELEVPLGRGGSGEVWRGKDMATQRPVVVKLVELSLIDDPGLLAETIGRFRSEATVISGLRQPNVVGALDAGRMGNQLFMTMDLSPGISLASMMDERAARGMGLFPVASVLRIAEQVCAGLAAAHEAGVVHRNIKPSNLMVTPPLDIKIIDFGIARLLADNSTRLMLPAHTVGTLAYMSPEQAQGLDVDGRADLYSLGCVLYQLLSGRPPFFSTLPGALLMMQVMDTAAPLNDARPDLPAGLSELVSELMEKEPAARPANAAEVISRIAAIEGTLGSEVPEYEADHETIWANDRRDSVGGTRLDEVILESGRSAVLTPERMPGLSGPNTVAATSWEPAVPAVGLPMPVHAPYPVPAQPASSIRSAPQAAAGRGGGTPNWPTAPGPRPRPVWRGVASILIVAALVAASGVYFWERTHQILKITSVGVTAANTMVGCNGTADIIGTISTNGHGGPITYQWIRGQVTDPPKVVDDPSGGKTVRVTLSWAFHGMGTGQAVAKLRILNPQEPQSAEGSLTFPYSCPK